MLAISHQSAAVAELADAPDLESGGMPPRKVNIPYGCEPRLPHQFLCQTDYTRAV